MTFYSAVSLYLPSLPLNAALKIPQTVSIGLIGSICIVYSTFGGIKAVTWTNLYHSILLLAAMITIVIVGTVQSGGLGHVLNEAFDGGRMSLGTDYFRFDLTTRHTIFNTVLGYTLVRLFLHGTSQMQVQSALSLSTMRKSQASQLISAVLYLIIQIVASSIGLLLYVKYKDCDPYASGAIKRQDELIVHYVSESLGTIPALQGFFIAAIFGSTLTSMSSFQSSTSAMVVEDFIRPLFKWYRISLSDERAATLGKLMAFTLGFTCIVLTFEMDKIHGLQQATTTLYGVVGIPIFAAFLLGALTRFINTKGMFAGMVASMAFGVYVFVSQIFNVPPLEPSLPISTSGCAPANQTPVAANLSSLSKADNPLIVQVTIAQLVEANDYGNSLAGDFIQMVPVACMSLAQMSYLWLPVFTLVIATVVSSLVSALTGGPEQEVDDKFLAPICFDNKKIDISDNEYKSGAKSFEHQFDDNICQCKYELDPEKPMKMEKVAPPVTYDPDVVLSKV